MRLDKLGKLRIIAGIVSEGTVRDLSRYLGIYETIKIILEKPNQGTETFFSLYTGNCTIWQVYDS